MLEPVTIAGGIVIAKVVVAKTTAASTAYAATIVAVHAAITGAIAGGSTAGLVIYLSTPGGTKALKRVITRLSLSDWVKLAENIAKSARVVSDFIQSIDVEISELGHTAQAIRQGLLIVA